jgi:phosphotransferase system HPr-like phosphotransfer protein
VKCGSTVRLSVGGDQAELAINHLTKLIESDFDLASVSEDQISK